MFRLKLTPVHIATIIAGALVLASLAGSVLYNLITKTHSITAGTNKKTLASACTPNQKNEKIYFVSCGGTF